ncbi:hypothetical protein MAC_08361 [Metarhizium acridum CQMa 102]|uniref:Amidohydrolase n=2 Tax=Metarhizium acridum TaxID=92637 RepID=E9EER3_METAQ|nr:uncharacterized protein MAC_08361 [Metarhizium acridum CQMa 102]EFY85581.1 hypothetical protein MAC_08361 [Metarhizium acridum CQMa 102]
MELKTITVHAGTIFDPKAKKFKENVSITVDPGTGSIVHVLQRNTGTANIREGDIDLRDKIVMPGFVDAHTHIFLHAYNESCSEGAALRITLHTATWAQREWAHSTQTYEMPSTALRGDRVSRRGQYPAGQPFGDESPRIKHLRSIPAQEPVVMFNQDEMKAMVEEAHLAGLPVACHAATAEGAAMAAKAGITSIEHETS